jgi:LPXTG-motif cell wall-anchored protein
VIVTRTVQTGVSNQTIVIVGVLALLGLLLYKRAS